MARTPRPTFNRRRRDPFQIQTPPLVCAYYVERYPASGPEWLRMFTTGPMQLDGTPAWTCGSETLLEGNSSDGKEWFLRYTGDVDLETEVTFPNFPEVNVGPNTQWVQSTLVIA